MMIYECPKHGDSFRKKGCEDCSRILRVIASNKEASARVSRTKKLPSSIHWPGVGPNGRVVQNLENRPQYFATKRAFRDYLKAHNVSEAG